jgi:hypothetical protein
MSFHARVRVLSVFPVSQVYFVLCILHCVHFLVQACAPVARICELKPVILAVERSVVTAMRAFLEVRCDTRSAHLRIASRYS